MRTRSRTFIQLALVLLTLAALFGVGHPAYAACSPSVSLDLWAKKGTATLFGSTTAPIWGYAAASGDPAGLPGPVLSVTTNTCVQVTLHNVDIPENTALLFQGQALPPDTAGIAAGASKSYTFLASNPGTFLYEAGLIPNAQHQVAMGLYGALVVRPTTAGTAYGTPASAYNIESVLVLSELDPLLNSSASPATFDMRNYNPRYFLINGKAYPGTAAITAPAGARVLLRYANAGLQAHAMGTLGFSQSVIAQDGSPNLYPHSVVAESVATGQTLDTIASIPAAAANGSKFAIYDANMLLRNNTGPAASNSGGMLTFVTASAGAPGTDTTGPLLSLLALNPNPSNGTVSVALTFTASDATTGNGNVTAAEYWVDSGAHQPISIGSPAPTVSLSATIPAGLSAGTHVVSMRAQDAAGNWSSVGTINLVVDTTGPASSGLSLSPNPSSGSVAVSLSFTASDSASGGSNVTAAEYWVDSGVHQAITGFTPAPVVTINASIPAGLSAGTHSVTVRARDALGNWGASISTNLVIDQAGPTTSGVSAVPNPNNGTLGLNTSIQAVRVSASFSDAGSGGSNLAAAEGFLDTVGTTGTGFAFVATDGAFSSPAESGYGDIPLPVVNALAEGNHNISVHAKDAAGNWGAFATTTLVIDKTIPTFTSITLSPNPTNGAAAVTLTVNGASDPTSGGVSSGVAGGEYWLGATNPAPGGGTQFTGLTASINVASLATGTYTVSARVRDAAGNWSSVIRSATLTVVPNAIFSDGFESGNFNAWSSRSTTSTTRMNVTGGAAMVGSFGMQAQGNNTNYVQYTFGTAANPVSATFDARFYFRPNANSSTGKDIFSAATSSTFGSTLFRVRYRLNGSTPQAQIQVGSTTNNTWTNLLGGTSNNVIEVVWQAGTSLQLYVNGALAQTLTAGSGSVGAFRLGSVTSTGSSTNMYFDAFSAKRATSPLFGP